MTATLPVVDRKARRAAVAGGVGSVVEWYDYGLYGIAAALYIRPLFVSGLFGTRRRFAGVATTRELNSAFLAGPAPFAAALTGAVGGSPWPVG